MRDANVALLARVLLATALVYAATRKLRTPRATRVSTIALVGERLGAVVAVSLPFAELAVALALLLWWSIVPGIVAIALLSAFTGVVISATTRRLPCPCFGGGPATPAGPRAIVRNGVLLALAIVALGSAHGASLVLLVLAGPVVLGGLIAGLVMER